MQGDYLSALNTIMRTIILWRIISYLPTDKVVPGVELRDMATLVLHADLK